MKQKPYQLESTGDDRIDRNLRKIGEALDEVARTINGGVIQAPGNRQAGNYQITTESFVTFIGGAGHVLTLPKADSLGGKSWAVFIMNDGTASVQVRASGSDTLYTSTGTSSTAPTTATVSQNQGAIFVSDGVGSWKNAGRSDPLTVSNFQIRVLETLTNRSIAFGQNGSKQLFSWTTGDGSAGSAGYPQFIFNGLLKPTAYDASHPTVMLFGNGHVLQFGTSGDVLVTVMLGGGLQIGSTATEKVAYHGATPVGQGAAIADATGAGDVVAQLNLLLADYRTRGFVAP